MLTAVAARIVGVNGSLRSGSSADRALHYLFRLLEEGGATCETFDIAGLPLLDGRPDDGYPPTVAQWRTACSTADALVVAVPSYHGAIPGGLKNALDFIDSPQVGGKPFAIIGIAGGDAEPAVTDTARVLRHIGAIAAVPDVAISRAAEHWGRGADPADATVAESLHKVAENLLQICELRAKGRLPSPSARSAAWLSLGSSCVPTTA